MRGERLSDGRSHIRVGRTPAYHVVATSHQMLGSLNGTLPSHAPGFELEEQAVHSLPVAELGAASTVTVTNKAVQMDPCQGLGLAIRKRKRPGRSDLRGGAGDGPCREGASTK